ncbi:MAG TPA: Crp/Fnr family transcriptional regulator [Pyrinomonadaceae bacterium]|jgi:CRP-like cAMP-binding protein
MSETIKPANRLLAALPAEEYAHLLQNLEEIPLKYAETLYEQGEAIRYIYFPNSGMISLLTYAAEDEVLEVGVVGNEGIIGLPVFLGVETSRNQVIVQGDGAALRIKTEDFIKECGRGASLPKLLRRYTHALITQVSQTVACNRFHLIEERLMCWLLLMHDRMQTDKFKITQDFLSKMLGVRREAVSKSAANLQQRKLIEYSRGIVSIINRAALEAAACNCYSIVKAEYDNLPA